MAKDYQKGDCYRLFIDTGFVDGVQGTVEWHELKSVDDLSMDLQIGDIEVPERGRIKGHFTGQGDPVIAFTLMEDVLDTTGTQAIIDAMLASMTACAETPVRLALAQDDIGTDGTVTPGGGVLDTIYYTMECVVTGSLSANQGDVASWDCEARNWANSENGLQSDKVAAGSGL